MIDEKVFFDYDSANLRSTGQEKLAEIVAEYQQRGGAWKGLRVQGHADARGPQEYNRELSQERGQAVKSYLVSQGIPESLLDVEAYGETKPAVPAADTEAEHQRNRRVEFVIVRK